MKRLKERKVSQEKDIKMNASTNEYSSKLNELIISYYILHTEEFKGK